MKLADEAKLAEDMIRAGAPNEDELLVWWADCLMETALEASE